VARGEHEREVSIEVAMPVMLKERHGQCGGVEHVRSGFQVT
jgi:hypothetical protein